MAVTLLTLLPLTLTTRSSAEQLPVTRTGGTNRAATAVEISRAAWVGGADTVVLARSDVYPDALSAAPLATALDAPLLLTRPDRLEPVVAGELERLGATEVVLLGGELALTPQVAARVEELGADVRRIAGSDRFATSAKIADELEGLVGTGDRSAFVARATQGKGWPDALAAAPIAARRGRPLLLADQAALPYSDTWLQRYEQLTFVGGSGVLDDRLLQGRSYRATRVSGPDRFATSLALADAALADLGAGQVQVWLTTGANFPDALAAGPAVAARDAVLLLVPPAWFTSPTRAWITEHIDRIGEIRLLGAEGALSETIATDLARMDPEVPHTLEPPPDEFVLMYSTRSDLEGAERLDGARVFGEIHVFLARCDADGRCSADL